MLELETTKPSAALPDDPISGPVRDVVAIFDAAADQLRFPDMDAGVLRAAVEAVEAAQDEVRRLEAALLDARRRLEDTQDGLLHKAQRALAYARIFAESDPALLARLERIERIEVPRGRGTKAPAPAADPLRRRRRGGGVPELLFAVPAGEAAGDASPEAPSGFEMAAART